MTADKAKQVLEFSKVYGIPTVLLIVLFWFIVIPVTDDYRAMATRTIEIQGQMADTLREMAQVQSSQAQTLEELTRITHRSTECIQRVEDAVRRLDARVAQPGM